MYNYSHFSSAQNIKNRIDNIFKNKTNDHVSYTFKTPLFQSGISTIALPTGNFEGVISSKLTHGLVSASTQLSTAPYFSLNVHLHPTNNLNFKIDFSSPPPKDKKNGSHNKHGLSIFNLDGSFKIDSYLITGALGLLYDRSMSFLASLQHPLASGSFHCHVTERTNILKLAAISNFGPFGSIKGDIALMKLNQIEFGWMRNWQKGVAFLSFELMETAVHIATESKIGKTVSVGLKGRIKGADDIKGRIGVKVDGDTQFSASLGLDGQISMSTLFQPKEWCTITLRSSTSALTKFQPVQFGWSLDFQTLLEKHED